MKSHYGNERWVVAAYMFRIFTDSGVSNIFYGANAHGGFGWCRWLITSGRDLHPVI